MSVRRSTNKRKSSASVNGINTKKTSFCGK